MLATWHRDTCKYVYPLFRIEPERIEKSMLTECIDRNARGNSMTVNTSPFKFILHFGIIYYYHYYLKLLLLRIMASFLIRNKFVGIGHLVIEMFNICTVYVHAVSD